MSSTCSTSFKFPYSNSACISLFPLRPVNFACLILLRGITASILNLGFSFTLRPIYHQTKGLKVPIG